MAKKIKKLQGWTLTDLRNYQIQNSIIKTFWSVLKSQTSKFSSTIVKEKQRHSFSDVSCLDDGNLNVCN